MRRLFRRSNLLSSSTLIIGVSSIFLVAHLASAARDHLSSKDQAVINRFTQIYYDSLVWGGKTHWLGIPILQTPTDNWIMQEIITEVKPDFIIETGTFHGGTALFYASILEMVNKSGKVITIDIDPKVEQVSKLKIFRDHVEVIKGDSVSPEVINAIAARVRGHKVLVTLDSLHTKEHVLKEMRLYSDFVSLNSYMVVQDTVVNGHPLLPDFGEGPMEAVEEFLKTRNDFAIDRSKEKFLLTFYPSGYLKKMASKNTSGKIQPPTTVGYWVSLARPQQSKQEVGRLMWVDRAVL